jgi:hypothetical protein
LAADRQQRRYGAAQVEVRARLAVGSFVASGYSTTERDASRVLWIPVRNRDLFVTQSPVKQGVLGPGMSVVGAVMDA